MKKFGEEVNAIIRFVEWILGNKKSILSQADISKADKEKILYYFGISNDILYK